ncbi:UNVERIFIED_CONTAM: hypothetical protein FKN15_046310 [Acipenser sinensis]
MLRSRAWLMACLCRYGSSVALRLFCGGGARGGWLGRSYSSRGAGPEHPDSNPSRLLRDKSEKERRQRERLAAIHAENSRGTVSHDTACEERQMKWTEKEKIVYSIPTKPGEKKDTSVPLPAGYSPQYVEACWYAWWEKQGFFQPEYHAVVEKRLYREKGVRRQDLSREEFQHEVWRWKEQKGDEIYHQLRKLGASLDWERACFTMDKNLHGRHARHPFTGRLLPILTDPLVDPHLGTGAVKCTPAHDPRDFEVSLRHALPCLSVIGGEGTMTELCGDWLQGVKRFEARQRVLDALKERGLYRSTQEHAMLLPLCSRSGDVVEPLLKSQWFLRCDQMARRAMEAVDDGQLDIIPSFHKKTWKNWLSNISDWCISRQLWWGHQIPAYRVSFPGSCDKQEVDSDALWVCGQNQEEVKRSAAKKFGIPENLITVTQGLVSDTDVLDTWFSSGLFPFAMLGWPEQTPDLHEFYPNSLLETGSDLIFFWVARMVMLGQELTGQLPFSQVFLHSMIRDAHGRKMSKSLGNVIDPLDVISGVSLQQLHEKVQEGNLDPREISIALEGQCSYRCEGEREFTLRFALCSYRCEGEREFTLRFALCSYRCEGEREFTLRFALCSYRSQGDDINLDVGQVVTARHFCNKIWNAVKFTLGALGDQFEPLPLQEVSPASAVDRWVLSRLHHAAVECERGFEHYDFHAVTVAVHSFWLHSFCDVYLEVVRVVRSLRAEYQLTKTRPELYVQCSELRFREILESFSTPVQALCRSGALFLLSTLQGAPSGCAVGIVNDSCQVYLKIQGLVDLQKELAKLGVRMERLQAQLDQAVARTWVQQYEERVPQHIREENTRRGFLHLLPVKSESSFLWKLRRAGLKLRATVERGTRTWSLLTARMKPSSYLLQNILSMMLPGSGCIVTHRTGSGLTAMMSSTPTGGQSSSVLQSIHRESGMSNITERYTLIEELKTWTEAQQYCREHHTDLVSIKSASENEDLVKKAQGKPFWIGLFNNPWKWSRQSYNYTFHNWDNEEPNNVGGSEGGSEGCVVMDYNGLFAPASSQIRKLLFVEAEKSWSEAQSYCRERYTDLVTVDSQDEAELLFIAEHSLNDAAWIGLYRDTQNWQWSNSDDVIYSNWRAYLFCASVNSQGEWDDLVCSEKKAFMCFKETSNITERYTLIEELKTWTEAQQYCREHHTDLVSIKSASENEDLVKKAQGKPFWIGLFNNPWKWSRQSYNYTFHNWDNEEPNNVGGSEGGSEGCVVMDYNATGSFLIYNTDHNKCVDAISSSSVVASPCNPDAKSQQFRWVSEYRLQSVSLELCLGVASKTDWVRILLYPCDEKNELQQWECKDEDLFAIQGANLFLNYGNTNDGKVILYHGSGPWSRWNTYGTDVDLCPRLSGSHEARVNETLDLLNSTGSSDAWIGLYHDKENWQWSKGDAFIYYNWSTVQFCASVNSEGEWEDRACSETTRFMCYSDNMAIGRVKFTAPKGVNLEDPKVSEAILEQIRQHFSKKFPMDGVNMRWRKQDGEIFHKDVEEEDEEKEEEEKCSDPASSPRTIHWARCQPASGSSSTSVGRFPSSATSGLGHRCHLRDASDIMGEDSIEAEVASQHSDQVAESEVMDTDDPVWSVVDRATRHLGIDWPGTELPRRSLFESPSAKPHQSRMLPEFPDFVKEVQSTWGGSGFCSCDVSQGFGLYYAGG